MVPYTHQAPGTDVECIGGCYTITGEGRLDYRDGVLLYVVGVAVIDRSCCGTGGCRFVHVPGYIRAWHHETGPGGQRVSAVEPVSDPQDRRAIAALLNRQFPHSQITFLDA